MTSSIWLRLSPFSLSELKFQFGWFWDTSEWYWICTYQSSLQIVDQLIQIDNKYLQSVTDLGFHPGEIRRRTDEGRPNEGMSLVTIREEGFRVGVGTWRSGSRTHELFLILADPLSSSIAQKIWSDPRSRKRNIFGPKKSMRDIFRVKIEPNFNPGSNTINKYYWLYERFWNSELNTCPTMNHCRTIWFYSNKEQQRRRTWHDWHLWGGGLWLRVLESWDMNH
jgi:hypothetical protein